MLKDAQAICSPLLQPSPDRNPQEAPKTAHRHAPNADAENWNGKGIPMLRAGGRPDGTNTPYSPSREPSPHKLPPLSGTGNPPSSDPYTLGNLSPRYIPSRSRAGSASVENSGELKLMPYGHHRQTSIVHGIQHSGNGSLGPLSPQIIAAAGSAAGDAPTMGRADNDVPPAFSIASPSSNLSFGTSAASSTTTLVPERVSPGENSVNTHTQKRIERMHSGAGRREHGHHPSHSRHHYKEESKPVGEYALHVLFTSFIAQADEKIGQCITTPLEPEPQIERICGQSADPNFDQLISALGHIAAQKPKPLIDTLMLWRKKKSDAASAARNELQQYRNVTGAVGGGISRRNTEPGNPGQPADTTAQPNLSLATMQNSVAQAERRSTVSIYILCRVLTEVIGQSTLARITPEMEEKLEGIIFSQLKIADTESLASSPLKLANWHLFSQLLGVMSNINFQSVTGRFIADLEKSQLDLEGRNQGNREIEGRMELVLGGMKHLRIKTYPEASWEQSCDFMVSLGRAFAKSHGQRVKYAYCQILDAMLLPIAAVAAGTELNVPKWSEVLVTIGQRLASMMAKPRHWPIAFPLTATLLCASPPESFNAQWLQLILPLQSKLKDRLTRASCLQVISRLLWTYVNRCTDPPNATYRKLEEVVRMVLPPGKKTHTMDPSIVDPLIEIIRIIGFKHQEFCFRTIIFPLINSDRFAPGKDVHSVRVDQLEPEKMVIGIRAFLAIMADLEKGESGRPPFPQSYQSNLHSERLPTSPILASPKRIPSQPQAKERADRLSRPVATSCLSDVAKDYYKRFCEILGKITIICDETFGGQAVLDEKFNSPTPKTPIVDSFNFSRRDDILSPVEQRHGYYELLHVAVQALPRCLSADIPFNSLINLLCTGTAHVQQRIADSSAQSIKSIARQSHAQQVTIGFARFIFSFDDKYSTMSDGGMLGPTHVENTLKLYVELLQIWIEEIKLRSKEAAGAGSDEAGAEKRGAPLDVSGIWAHVEEVESHGLFFLCSQSKRVRSFAVTVLRLITEYDAALGQDNVRLIQILEGDSARVMSFNDEHLTVAERSRLQRGLKRSNSQSALVELCSSDVSYDTTLWFKIFPNLMKISYGRCPVVVTLGRELICDRILQMYKGITALSEARTPQHQYDGSGSRIGFRPSTTPPEVMVEQWKLYLIVACTTLTEMGGPQLQPATQMQQHLRNGSKTALIQPKINSARTLFKYILPLLSVGHPSVREAVVVALGSININIYKTLLEELQDAVSRCNDDARARIHQRTGSSSRRSRRTDTLRTEVTQVYRLTAHFLREESIYGDDWILNNLVVYAKDLKLFLMDGEVQMDWEFQKLRRHYCGLMEELFEGINRTKDPSRWMTFEMRKSSFALMEDWCGYSPNQVQIQHREEIMKQSMIDRQTIGERPTINAAMEKEKNSLRTAALSAMATLCGGPISVTTESKANLQFDLRRMLLWIDAIFSTESDRMHVIGRRALKNLITHNKEYPYLLEHSISRCYTAEVPKALHSYFEVVTQVLLEHPDYPVPFWRTLGIGLYTLGSDQSEIRSKSTTVLRALEERQNRNSKIQDFDISISDKTKAVYKRAQFEISMRLAKHHSDSAFLIFSEFTVYFKSLKPMAQQNMVATILPWIQTIKLQVDPNGGPTAQSYVLLANLFEITIKSSSALHNEVQALWQALATGPHAGNVQIILDFNISLCLDRREQNFVEYAKQIVVFLSSTLAGVKVVEFLLMQITPKAMIPNEKRESPPTPPDTSAMPYVAELSEALPMGAKQAGFSLGQLSLILLVDLMVAPVHLLAESVPLLLQVVTVLWDHYTPLVQDQAREMLIHLIHELVISRIDDETTVPSKREIEDLIEAIRRHDSKIVWAYGDSNGKVDDRDNKVPTAMENLATQVVNTFEVTYPGIKEQWGKLSLTWATSCPVRHLACRSFQIFRCILTSLDQTMLADMLARLSNTIADEDAEIQTFSMEILTTLKTLISKLEPKDLITFPQLFWTACACLDTINELEFMESLGMLDELLLKLDLSDAMVVMMLSEGQPPKWDGNFEGLQPLVYKGLRSASCLDQTLVTLNKLVQIPSGDLVGNDNRLLFAILANFPSFLHSMDQGVIDPAIAANARILAEVADSQACGTISVALGSFAASRYRTSKDFLSQLIAALRDNFFPRWSFQALKFLMGFLTNSLPWFKVNTMRILCVFIPEIDMRLPEIASHGPDMISPLLRLLQTEFCTQALEVLDCIMTMTGTPMDDHHLRMSMAGGRSSKAIRKEYERTQSLFGIPEDSGWSIPMPAKHAETTRSNVHAAFYMCQNAESTDLEAAPNGDVEFHVDEFQYGYFPPQDRADTMMSDEVRTDGNIGDLVNKLDSLDDFFEDTLQSPSSDGRSSRTVTEFGGEFESGAELYDEQTLPILTQSLGRTSSTTSFQNGFADMRPGLMSRQPSFNSMNPGAFSKQPASANRRSMHSRSVTSPSAPSSHQPDFMSDDEYAAEVFSDGEEGRATPGEGGFFLESMIRPLAQQTRSGMRRLTGGRTRESERLREQVRMEARGITVPKSPMVPKVPREYLSQSRQGVAGKGAGGVEEI
ncbi:hypothetical protein VE00_06762 [Pseudogymnoascus sp. WSF 3629]|nr:hypothetical protein VE00_06762 [Pseudogymnoascus sp. WSF 3629]